MQALRVLAFASLTFAACGDNLHPTDVDARAIDAPADASVDGPCTTGRYVTGELVDIDSSTTSLSGVNNAAVSYTHLTLPTNREV